MFFIMIMNRLHCEGRMLECAHAALEKSLDFFFLLTVEATTPISHKDNRNCKRFAFICVHSQ